MLPDIAMAAAGSTRWGRPACSRMRLLHLSLPLALPPAPPQPSGFPSFYPIRFWDRMSTNSVDHELSKLTAARSLATAPILLRAFQGSRTTIEPRSHEGVRVAGRSNRWPRSHRLRPRYRSRQRRRFAPGSRRLPSTRIRCSSRTRSACRGCGIIATDGKHSTNDDEQQILPTSVHFRLPRFCL